MMAEAWIIALPIYVLALACSLRNKYTLPIATAVILFIVVLNWLGLLVVGSLEKL